MVKLRWLALAVLALGGNTGCAFLSNMLKAPPPPLLKDAGPGVELVFVKGGCFQMGTPKGTPGGPEERPAHEVCVGDFYLGKYEVTQGQWKAVMGANPSHHGACGDGCPVEMVSWVDAQAFLAKLNALPGPAEAPPGQYRLPTEAEWEYAARSGGKVEKYAGWNNDIDAVACYAFNTVVTCPVGTKAPNGLGLFDMSGNVWEWTGDWYDPAFYSKSPRLDPTGPASGEMRVLRGGSFVTDGYDMRTTYRNFLPPDHRSFSRGLRVVRTVPQPAK